jgi:hypothetical protein
MGNQPTHRIPLDHGDEWYASHDYDAYTTGYDCHETLESFHARGAKEPMVFKHCSVKATIRHCAKIKREEEGRELVYRVGYARIDRIYVPFAGLPGKMGMVIECASAKDMSSGDEYIAGDVHKSERGFTVSATQQDAEKRARRQLAMTGQLSEDSLVYRGPTRSKRV